MTATVETKPEFRSVTAAAVLGALGDGDPANRIAAEVARLTDAFSAFFDRDARAISTAFFQLKPRWPIEAMAMRLALEEFEQAVRHDAAAARQPAS
jgi:hypothetical protein